MLIIIHTQHYYIQPLTVLKGVFRCATIKKQETRPKNKNQQRPCNLREGCEISVKTNTVPNDERTTQYRAFPLPAHCGATQRPHPS